MSEDLLSSYTSFPSVASDQTSLRLYPCNGEPVALVLWLHGGGWVSGDRRRIRNMPEFFSKHQILFASANYPLEPVGDQPLIELQLSALQALDHWLTSNPYTEKYSRAFTHITILAHSAASHLVALADKIHGWNSAVSSLVLMDTGAYDLKVRWRLSRPQQRRTISVLLGLDQRPDLDVESVLQSYSPALLSSKPRSHAPLSIALITSMRPGALHGANQLSKSYAMDGYDVSLHTFSWDHEHFPDAVGVDRDLNQLLLRYILS